MMDINGNVQVFLCHDIFIFPSGGDESLAMGAAMYAYSEILDKKGEHIRLEALGPIYLGMEFTNSQIKSNIETKA